MADLIEAVQWEATIYQLETTDPVKGGNDGISNRQAKQLANRTAYLKQQVELKAPLASPTFTGTPVVPTAAADTNTAQVASTEFVIGQAATAAPLVDGNAAVGTSKKYARQDHVHPSDGTRVSIGNLQKGTHIFAVDTGVANAYVCNFTPALDGRGEGQVIRFKVTNTNTGAATINDGVGVVPLVGGAHSALQGGEMVAGSEASAQWNSTLGTGSYVLLSCAGAPEQVANGNKSQHAITLGQFSTIAISTGLIKSVKRKVFSASGTYTPSPGMVYCDVEIVGGGGGGGGATGGSGTSSAGAGGGGGGYAKKTFTAAQIGVSQTVTIGAGGVGVSGNSTGGTGGTTTFGALLTATGGFGGGGSNASTVAGIPAAGGAGGTASGGDINVKGGNGFASFLLGGAAGGLSGQGGNTIYGAGGYPSGPVGAGNEGSGYGGGASGGASNTASTATGATGASGMVIVNEYCTQ